MDLLALARLSGESAKRVTLEATVTTGLESVAMSECKEKLAGLTEICTARGRVYMNVDLDQMEQVHALRSIDNLFLVVGVVPSLGLNGESMEGDMERVGSWAERLDWLKALDVWTRNEPFPGVLFPTAEQHARAVQWETDIKRQAVEATNRDRPVEEPGKRRPNRKQRERLRHEEKTVVAQACQQLDTRTPSEIPLRFRVTCHRVGTHCFGSQDAATAFGGKLQDMFRWVVDLEGFHLEVTLSLREDAASAGVALTRASKHRRNITAFGATTLRATCCYLLLALGEPSKGDVVVDAMCGGGSIPIEGAMSLPGVFLLGGEVDPEGVDRASRNCPSNRAIDLISWDATQLPLRDAAVDLFCIDLPFGRRVGCQRDNRLLYPAALAQLARAARLGTGRAVLLTQDRRSMAKALAASTAWWEHAKTHAVNIGGLNAAVYLLKRNGRGFHDDAPKTQSESKP